MSKRTFNSRALDFISSTNAPVIYLDQEDKREFFMVNNYTFWLYIMLGGPDGPTVEHDGVALTPRKYHSNLFISW